MDTLIETPPAASSPATDDKPAESSPATDDKPAESSPAVETVAASTPAGDRKAFHESLKAQVKETQEDDSPPPETDTEIAPKVEADKDEQAETEVAKVDPPEVTHEISFDKRPEWQAIAKVAGEKFKEVRPILRKLFERETHLTEQVKGLQVHEGIVNRLKASTGDNAGFNNALNLIEQYAFEPGASVPMLERLLKDARSRAGLDISSPDLKEQLTELDRAFADEGMTDKEYQRQKTLLETAEKTRAESEQARGKVKAMQETERQQRTDTLIKSREIAVNDWEKRAMKDPDYPKRANFVLERVKAAVDERHGPGKPLMSAQEMVELCEETDAAVKKELLGLLPKTKASRALTSDSSSRNSRVVVTDPREAFKQKLREQAGIE